ncbi:TIGR02588 family protein [filamentous cyanobacterium CCP5]|nr:TIGR02588 family protein [filamentous cyanobacterium CCP5]
MSNFQPSDPKAADSAKRSLAEWITFAIAASILMLVVGLVVYDWQVAQNRPPAFRVEITETARVTDGRYYVPFTITNTGRRIARTVQVTAELRLDDQVEAGEQQIDFLSGSERKRGSFVFSHDPQSGELTIRVASYSLP